jgi:hypothetical protein
LWLTYAGIEVSSVVVRAGHHLVGVTSTPCFPPDPAVTAEDSRLVKKHVLILLAGKAAEERALSGDHEPTASDAHT